MAGEFEGRVAFVTGASSGIGRATALKLAEEGARVALVARNETVLEDIRRDIHELGGDSIAIAADLTQESQAADAVAEAHERLGALDILVNAAGIIANGTIENTPLAQWDTMMNINLRSVFHLMQLAVPHLARRPGSIVNVSSVTGLRAFPGVLAYCVSKAGLDQLTRCAALELAPRGIRVNAVNPGVVVTEIHRRGGMSDQTYEGFLQHSKSTHPLGRVGTAAEVADLICFLASDRASWITGATYSIDGGRAQTCAR